MTPQPKPHHKRIYQIFHLNKREVIATPAGGIAKVRALCAHKAVNLNAVLAVRTSCDNRRWQVLECYGPQGGPAGPRRPGYDISGRWMGESTTQIQQTALAKGQSVYAIHYEDADVIEPLPKSFGLAKARKRLLEMKEDLITTLCIYKHVRGGWQKLETYRYRPGVV